MLRWLSLLLLFILPACTMVQTTAAPVSDLGASYAKQQGYYTVSRGETLYFVAWRLDIDYQQLADSNGLQSPYKIHAGQKLLIGGSAVTPRPVAKATPSARPQPVAAPIRQWLWPAQGHVEGQYSLYNKGVNIVGKAGSPIIASAGGQVVYAGNGLKAYGNLLIIKNNDTYLSAYAYNKKLLVGEGDIVKQGQTIALMGSSGTQQQTMLHFEIRKQGKPVNPLLYLAKR